MENYLVIIFISLAYLILILIISNKFFIENKIYNNNK